MTRHSREPLAAQPSLSCWFPSDSREQPSIALNLIQGTLKTVPFAAFYMMWQSSTGHTSTSYLPVSDSVATSGAAQLACGSEAGVLKYNAKRPQGFTQIHFWLE